MLHRVRMRARFTGSSGFATWCRDQMAVRYDQSVVIRDGEPAEEQPVNEVRVGSERARPRRADSRRGSRPALVA